MSLVLADVQPTENPKITEITVLKEFDGMTNKEVIETLFPSIELGEIHNDRHRFFLKGKAIGTFDLKAHIKWLNAPYKKGGE